MELLFMIAVAYWVIRGTTRDVVDGMAVARERKELPSTERWKARHPDTTPTSGPKGYFGRLISNGVNSWADSSARRHNRKKAWLDENESRFTADYVAKKNEKYDKKAARKEKWAAKRGVVWDKTKSAAAAVKAKASDVKDAAKTRRDEDEAHAENARRDEAAADDGPDADVLPFTPRPADSDGDSPPDSSTSPDGKDRITMTAPTTMEITSLDEAITYTRGMGKAMADLNVVVEGKAAELTATATTQRQAVIQCESAIAQLRALGVEGDHLAKMEAAKEQLSVTATAFEAAAKAVREAGEAATAANAQFTGAAATFEGQTGIAEQMQAAKAGGNRAGERRMYEGV